MTTSDDLEKAVRRVLGCQLEEMRSELTALRGDLRDVRSEIAMLRTEALGGNEKLRIHVRRVEQLLDVRLRAVGVIGRLVRLEERIGAM